MKTARNYDLDYLDELSGGDESFKIEMIRHFLGNTPNVLANLTAFLAAEEWKKFRDEIHKFTPNLNMMGISEIIPIANELERLSEKVIEIERIPDMYHAFEEHVRMAHAELVSDFS
jgi:HPt (histidine-containing phosphotransfer) domain-containing protein